MRHVIRGEKTGSIRQALQHAGELGLSSAELRAKLGDRVGPQYLYKVLAKLRSKGEVRSEQGRYFLDATTVRQEKSKSSGHGATESAPDEPGTVLDLRLDEQLERMKRDFDAYRRGYRDGWVAARTELKDPKVRGTKPLLYVSLSPQYPNTGYE